MAIAARNGKRQHPTRSPGQRHQLDQLRTVTLALDMVVRKRHLGQPHQTAAVFCHVGLAGPVQMLIPAQGVNRYNRLPKTLESSVANFNKRET